MRCGKVNNVSEFSKCLFWSDSTEMAVLTTFNPCDVIDMDVYKIGTLTF